MLTTSTVDIDEYQFELHARPSGGHVGSIRFSAGRRDLYILELKVSGHDNSAQARNPHPGVGRLLMYLACCFQKVGKVYLHPKRSALPFYRLMGMRSSDDSQTPVFAGERSARGKLQSDWLDVFDQIFSSARLGADGTLNLLEAEIQTVLACTETKAAAQWRQIAEPSL